MYTMYTEEVIKQLKQLKKEGYTYSQISKICGMPISTACGIIKGRSWKNVNP